MSSRAHKPPFNLEAFLTQAGPGKAILKFSKRQDVFRQGDIADAVFYIQSGTVKVTVISPHGKEAVIALLEAGQFLGEGCLHRESVRSATTTTTGDCIMTSITKKQMNLTLQNEPEFAEMFMSFLLARNIRFEGDLIDQLFNSSERRLARLLLLLADYGKDGGPKPIDSKITQETLADMIGTTRSRVSFFMNKFRKLGFIDYSDKIEVHNSLLQAVLHDKPELKTDD